MWNQLHIVPALVFSLLLLTSSSKAIFAQGNHCDPELPQITADSYGYRLRGDRCEGIYIRRVGVSSLQVGSLTESVEDFDPATNKNLLVQWAAPANASVHLRAYGLRHRLYYRMDSLRPAGNTSYEWSPNLLAAFNVRKRELGLVAWVSQPVDGQSREVYLPVRLTQKAAVNRSNRYDLVLMPGVELAEVFVSLASLNPDGKVGAYLKRSEALGWGYYPAERVITVAIPKPNATGLYYLEIGATKKAGGSLTMQVWFYHRN